MSITSIETLSWWGLEGLGFSTVVYGMARCTLCILFKNKTLQFCAHSPHPPARHTRAPVHVFLSQVFSLDVEARDLSKVVPTPLAT